MIKYEPEYYGKIGFASPKSLKQEVNVINVGALEAIAEKLQVQEGKDKSVVDLESLGYTKLLGAGKISKPLVVKAPSCSKIAGEKIRKAGGQLLIETEETGE
jgi:large subunit ribosomal protein L15